MISTSNDLAVYEGLPRLVHRSIHEVGATISKQTEPARVTTATQPHRKFTKASHHYPEGFSMS
jgi:hypothetical protein